MPFPTDFANPRLDGVLGGLATGCPHRLLVGTETNDYGTREGWVGTPEDASDALSCPGIKGEGTGAQRPPSQEVAAIITEPGLGMLTTRSFHHFVRQIGPLRDRARARVLFRRRVGVRSRRLDLSSSRGKPDAGTVSAKRVAHRRVSQRRFSGQDNFCLLAAFLPVARFHEGGGGYDRRSAMRLLAGLVVGKCPARGLFRAGRLVLRNSGLGFRTFVLGSRPKNEKSCWPG